MQHHNLTDYEHLTPRELDVLRLVCKGCSNKEIAQQLVLSVGTVKWYNKQIFQKLAVSNRSQAAIRARELQIVPESARTPTLRPKHNLPSQLTSFIGRKYELADIQRRLKATRLLTLTGPPGVGKTRLAVEVGHKCLADYRDGVWFVPLAALRDADLVTASIAHAFKINGKNDKPLLATLQDYFRNRELLLILDNFEHVLSSAPVVADILRTASVLTVLVTSRESLHLYGEQEYPVHPLPLPSFERQIVPEVLQANEALQLFANRAQAVAPEFQLTPENATDVAAICVQLDGVPLAIELAASRAKMFSPKTILSQLNDRFGVLVNMARDLPPRLQTLQGALDWSWQLLTTKEQALFCQLGVFAGSFSLEAVQAVCQPPRSSVDLLLSLMDKSLVHRTDDTQTRFTMLMTIREFALQQLKSRGDVARMRENHAVYYVDLVQQVDRKRRNGISDLSLLEDEHENLREALDWLLETHDDERALRMVGGLAEFWWKHGDTAEGIQWAKRALATSQQASSYSRACALRSLGLMLYEAGDFVRAMAACTDASEIFRQHKDDFELAWMLAYMGALLDETDDQRAISFLTEALALFRQMDSLPGIAFTLNHLGEVMRHLGEHEQAVDYYLQSIACRQKLSGWAGRPTRTLVNLGFALLQLAQSQQAKQAFRQSLANSLQMGLGLKWTTETLIGLASICAEESNWGRAVRLLGVVDAICMKFDLSIMYQAEYDIILGEVRSQVDPTEFQQAWTEGCEMPLDTAMAFALGTFKYGNEASGNIRER